MRVLVLSDTPFLPPTAGNRQRIHELVGFLRRAGVEVGMLMLPRADRPEWDERGMAARLALFEVAAPPLAARIVRRLRGGGASAVGAPNVDAWCPSWFRARARQVVDAWSPDVVIAEYVYLSACLDGLEAGGRGPLRVIDTHDVMHRREAAYAAAGIAPQWFRTSAAEEARGLARADLVLAIQEEEAAALRGLVPGVEVLTVPLACVAQPAPDTAARRTRILFVASYNDLNVAGLRWFVDAVWPALRAAEPALELHVCGSIAAKLPPMPAGVVVRGVVPSLREEYAAARVVIDPVGAGTGLPTKVVEALAHGRPVVARRVMPREVDGGVLVAGDAAGFAAAVGGLLADAAAWARAGRAALHCATVRFSPEVVFGPLLARLRSGR
jgi:succinoglycan biosynthesis protein ExoO